jgi:hypothetical protein
VPIDLGELEPHRLELAQARRVAARRQPLQSREPALVKRVEAGSQPSELDDTGRVVHTARIGAALPPLEARLDLVGDASRPE